MGWILIHDRNGAFKPEVGAIYVVAHQAIKLTSKHMHLHPVCAFSRHCFQETAQLVSLVVVSFENVH